MKFFIIFALAIFSAKAAPAADDVDVVELIKNTIKQILDQIPEPLIDVHEKESSLDLGVEQVQFKSIDAVISGIKNLDISTLTFDKESNRLDYEYNFAEIKNNIEVDAKLSGLLNVEHHPVAEVILNDLKLSGYAILSDSSPRLVTDLKVLVSLGGEKVSLKGILNDDALSEKLEGLLNKQLDTVVNDIAEQLEPVVSPIVKSLINLLIRLTN